MMIHRQKLKYGGKRVREKDEHLVDEEQPENDEQ